MSKERIGYAEKLLPAKYVPIRAQRRPKMAVKSREAALTLPFENAARGIVMKWILQRKKGSIYSQRQGSALLMHIMMILESSIASIRRAERTRTLFLSVSELFLYLSLIAGSGAFAIENGTPSSPRR